MAKQIQAYFRTEDEAEGARASLQAYRTEHLEVGALDETLGRETRVLIPLVPYNNTGSVSTGGSAGAAIPAGVLMARIFYQMRRMARLTLAQPKGIWMKIGAEQRIMTEGCSVQQMCILTVIKMNYGMYYLQR